MSFTNAMRPIIPFRRLLPALRARPSRADLHTGASFHAGQESSLHRDGRAEEAEAHKQDQLQKQKEGNGHWKSELASDSEAHIQAEKESASPETENIDDLQKQSQDHIHEKHGQK